MTHIKAFMLGPRAENLDLLRQLILETLDDHAYWRRNFHPEDLPAVSRHIQSSQAFRDWEDRLRDLLFTFLADSKQGIPFSSARYIGHMNTDLLLPALVGYFAAMLYNQNNVAGESSPVTARLEAEVVGMLARMVGYLAPGQPDAQATGYLTSGGTTANIYGLWVARNLRTWPLALRIALGTRAPSELVADPRIAAVAGWCPGPGRQPLSQASAWDLLNLPIETLYSIKDSLARAVLVTDNGHPGNPAAALGDASRFIDDLVQEHTIQRLGERVFLSRLRQLFPSEAALFENPWLVVVAANRHYSFEKAVDLLGIGKSGLRLVRFTDEFTMDVTDLQAVLTDALETRTPVLALVSIFGSTEEGSLDDVPAIAEVRDSFEAQGLACWLHIDACYGGYLPTVVRPAEGAPAASEAQIEEWLRRLGVQEYGLDADMLAGLIDSRGGPWLPWGEFTRRVTGLPRADSVSIDPHKLGYIPYPAGAVLLRNPAGQEVVSSDAPYLWSGQRHLPGLFVGRYTLEGSRPGATAAACWLAHRAIPLSQDGHGKVLAGSMLAARQLYKALKRKSEESADVKIAFVNRPHLNMLCYTPYHVASETLDEINCVTAEVETELNPLHHGSFMVVKTDVVLPSVEAAMRVFEESVRNTLLDSARPSDSRTLTVLRSVVMGPLSLYARTKVRREDGSEIEVEVFDVFAEHLVDVCRGAFTRVRAARFVDRLKKAQARVLVVDDDPAAVPAIRAALDQITDVLRSLVDDCTDEASALAIVRRKDRPLPLAFLDVDLGKGNIDGGWTIFKEICRRNQEVVDRRFRIEHVIFLTVGDTAYHERLEEMRSSFGSAVPQTRQIDKAKLSADPASVRGFLLGLR